MDLTGGCEWVVEAHGCSRELLRDLAAAHALLARIVSELELHPVCEPLWHKFPGEGGVTGLVLLAESHLACHTFPEYESACLNLFCCRAKPEWDFRSALKAAFGATAVTIRCLDRPYYVSTAQGHE